MKRIICVVDNTVQRGSQLWGEHGLAFWIETEHGCLLFDTGQSGTVLTHNLDVLGLRLHDVDALALSHAHIDHTGGMRAIFPLNKKLRMIANPSILRPRYSFSEGEYKSIGLPSDLGVETYTSNLQLNDSPVEVLPGLWTTGEIAERSEPEGRSASHFIQVEGEWHPDPYLDDMSLVMDTQKGLIIICGCCHAGLLNTLAHVRNTFRRPIIAILGGTHLANADDAYLEHVSNVLRDQYDPLFLYLNHCTGESAYLALANAFGARVKPCPAGTIYMVN